MPAAHAIQPHGAVLVLDIESLRIQAASTSTAEILGYDGAALIGQPATQLFTPRSWRRLEAAVSRRRAPPDSYLVLTLRESGRSCYGWLHVRAGMAILDLERCRRASAQSLQRLFSGLESITESAQSDQQDAFLMKAVKVIRKSLCFDRVLLRRFDVHGDASVIAQARHSKIESIPDSSDTASIYSKQFRDRLRKSGIEHFADLSCSASPLLRGATLGAGDLSGSSLRVDPSLEQLRRTGITALSTGSLVVRGTLWGVIECQQLRRPKLLSGPARLAFWRMCKEVAHRIDQYQISVARKRNGEREAALEAFAKCTDDGDLENLTADGKAELLLSALQADGFALLSQKRCVCIGLCPQENELRRVIGRLPAATQPGTRPLRWPATAERGGADFAGLLLADVGDPLDSRLLWFRLASNARFRDAGLAADPWSSDELSFAESLRSLIQGRREQRTRIELEFLHRSTANSNVMILISEAEPTPGVGRRILMASEAFERVTGYRVAEVIGTVPTFLFGPESGAGAMDNIREKLASGDKFEDEILLYRKDGSTFWADVRVSSVEDALGRRTHWISVLTDISERRRIRAGLEQKNRVLEDSLSESVALVQAKSTVLGQVGRELHEPLTIMLGQTEMALKLAQTPRVREALDVVCQTTRHTLDLVKTILDTAQLGMAAAPISKPAAQATLDRKATFFAAASHDLLQPLNAARIYASALSELPAIGSNVREAAQRIDLALIAAEEIIDVLVEVTKLDSGALVTEIEPFALYPQLEILAAQMSSLATSRQLQLRVPPCKWLVQSDRRLLRRVVQNLMANALRYTAEGGVLVGTRKRRGELLIEVWDTGIGIDAIHQSKVFEEFSRVNQRSPWGDRGSGLGLAICERICRLLGHSLTVVSKPGRGSCFRVAVPLLGEWRETEASPGHEMAAASADGLPTPMKVLCVDDDPDILRSMRALLSGWGVDVETAEDGAAALATIATFVPDVLLVDQQLGPHELGIELLRTLQLRLGSSLIGSALITADHSDALRERCKKHGHHLLYKPLKAVRLRGLMTHFAELAGQQGKERQFAHA